LFQKIEQKVISKPLEPAPDICDPVIEKKFPKSSTNKKKESRNVNENNKNNENPIMVDPFFFAVIEKLFIQYSPLKENL
jgi:hypothetical protein